jgi:hypothetical protein
MCVGHCYYFFEDVYPKLPADPHLQAQRQHVLGAPWFVKQMFGEFVRDRSDPTIPETQIDTDVLPDVEDTVDYEELDHNINEPETNTSSGISQEGLRKRDANNTNNDE